MNTYKQKCGVEKLYFATERKALKIVEQSAKKILQKYSFLDEFIMGMGGWFFTLKREDVGDQNIEIEIDLAGRSYWYLPDVDGCMVEQKTPKDVDSLNKFIDKWDDHLKITGTPMRFTAIGPTIIEWGAMN